MSRTKEALQLRSLMMGKDFVPSSCEVKRDYIVEMFGVNALPQVADI